MNNEKCENCRFFWLGVVRRINNYRDGVCIRYPQEIPKYIEERCGEYKPKEKKG